MPEDIASNQPSELTYKQKVDSDEQSSESDGDMGVASGSEGDIDSGSSVLEGEKKLSAKTKQRCRHRVIHRDRLPFGKSGKNSLVS